MESIKIDKYMKETEELFIKVYSAASKFIDNSVVERLYNELTRDNVIETYKQLNELFNIACSQGSHEFDIDILKLSGTVLLTGVAIAGCSQLINKIFKLGDNPVTYGITVFGLGVGIIGLCGLATVLKILIYFYTYFYILTIL